MIYLGGVKFWDGKKIASFKPYFYVISTGAVPGGVRTDLNARCWDGYGYRECSGRVYRVYVDHPAEVRALREKFEKTSQAYMPYVLRVSADSSKPPLVYGSAEDLAEAVKPFKPNFVAVDVEVHGREVLFGWASTEDREVKISGDVFDLFADLQKAEFAVGYNISKFDVVYLGSGSRLYIDAGRPVGIIDLMDFATGPWRSSLGVGEEAYALHEVVRQVGAPPDVDLKEWVKAKASRTKLTGAELRRYLEWDVKATLYLAERWLSTLSAVSSLAGVPLHLLWVLAARGSSPGALHDAALAKITELGGYVLEDRKRVLDFSGAEKVVVRRTGLFRRVAEYDFHMLYPTIFYELGVDVVESYSCERGFRGAGGARVCFRLGDSYRYLAKLYKAREATKRLKKASPEVGEPVDQAVKILANSAYGVAAKPAGYGLNEHAAAVIFNESARLFTRLVDRYGAIYGDTDSIYVPLSGDPYPDAEVSGEAQRIARELWGGSLLYGGANFSLKLEGIWDMYIHAAKNYLKWGEAKTEAKGYLFKPSGLPAGWKYGEWRQLLRDFALGARCWQEELRRLPPEEALLEESMDLADFFVTSQGTEIKKLDMRKRVPVLAKLLVESGGDAYTLHRGASGIVDVRFAYIEPGEKAPRLVVYASGALFDVLIVRTELTPTSATVVGRYKKVNDLELVYAAAEKTTNLSKIFGSCRRAVSLY